MSGLGGQVAVVAGGARGIGGAVTDRLREGGAPVAMGDMDAALANENAAALGKECVALAVEFAGWDSGAPGATLTPNRDRMSHQHIAEMLSKTSRGRVVERDRVTAMIARHCSPENSFPTAGVVDLAGGRATY